MLADGLIYNANIATFDDNIDMPAGTIAGGYVAWRNGVICAVDSGVPQKISASHAIDAKGKLVTPGFIDCHTHLIYAGDRAEEFEWRLQGRSYEDINRHGGGIMRTVEATRAAEPEELFALAKSRILRLFKSGVTTVEIKSGYGLNLEDELKLLHVIKRLQITFPLTFKATCLAAHVLPTDFVGSKDDYIAMVCNELLPTVKKQGLAESIDVFCEKIAFTPEHVRTLFSTAKSLGFTVKGHVEQLSQSCGIDVVCEFDGLSADHLEFANKEQIEKLQMSGSVAVLLPGAFYYLNQAHLPPVAAMRQLNVPMAVATDANPGTSPLFSITTAAHLACTQFALTPEEALRGVTLHAARALGLHQKKGVIKRQFDADLVLWSKERAVDLIYEMPCAEAEHIWIGGNIVTKEVFS